MLTRIMALGALNASMPGAAQATGTIDRTPPTISPARWTKPQLSGSTVCGCGRTISGNKLLCKRCGDAITDAINGLMRDRHVEEAACMQWADDGGPQ